MNPAVDEIILEQTAGVKFAAAQWAAAGLARTVPTRISRLEAAPALVKIFRLFVPNPLHFGERLL